MTGNWGLVFLEVAEDDLDASPRAGEDHRLDILVQQVLRQPYPFEQG